ncbi:hypothetical protein [Stagnihabitans tardus]|uniref:Uncharacterized protein n=1 Tax=Stagnihabitans tardus TaxID=2699202 RepID=A0AAE4YAN3_9RHOB|nr:hypothetical protein [Stagnihabitans tardus]NBZ89101.1 hypothetical protein [Stagnihabitans tardus]
MRRLPLLLLLLPSPLRAEVCDKEAPDWDGVPVTALSPVLDFWTSLPGLALAAVFLMALLVHRRAMTLLALAAGLLPLVWFYGLDDGANIRTAAIREGCAGPPWLLTLSLLAPALLLFRRS